MGRSGKRSLGIDDPIALSGSLQEMGKGCGRLQRSKLAGKSELVFCKSSFEASHELFSEDRTEYFDGQKELVPAGNPAAMIVRESPSGNYAM